MKWRYLSGFCASVLSLLFLWAGAANAVPVETIKNDFKPISGYVVDKVQGHVLIDLGDSSPVSGGDLFTISIQGKEIVHPVSKKVLGHVKAVQALLQVTKVDTGFSYTQPLSGASDIEPGQPVERYGHMKSLFWDFTGQDEVLYQKLRSAIPHLMWQNFYQSQKLKPEQPKPLPGEPATQLYFIKQNGRIEVRGPCFGLIHAYSMKSGQPVDAGRTPVSGTRGRVETGDAGLYPEPGEQKIKYEKKFSQLNTIATLDEPVVMADFLSTAKGHLMAFSNGKRLCVAKINGKLQRLAAEELSYPGRVLSLSWWTPQNRRQVYLVANIWYNRQMQSAVFRYTDGTLSCIRDRIPKLLSAFDTDSDHKPETLLGQEFDEDTVFGRRIWEGKLSNDSIAWTHPDINLPRQFQVTGSALADVTGDNSPEALFILNNTLFISDQDRVLYKSSVPVGGSLSSLLYEPEASGKHSVSANVVFDLAPLIRDLDNDGKQEIMIPSLQQGFFAAVTGRSGTQQSQLLILDYEQNHFEQGTLGGPVDGSIQGLTISGDTVFLVSSKKGEIFKSGGTTLVHSFLFGRN